MQDLPPAGGGFLIPAGAVALDKAEAWTKVGAERSPLEWQMAGLLGLDFASEKTLNKKEIGFIFSPVMVLCAKEGVDTLTKVRLIEEALEIEQNFPDDKEKHLIVIFPAHLNSFLELC